MSPFISTAIPRAASLILSFGLVLCAQSSEDILKQYQEADKANEVLARQYTFTEKTTHVFFDKSGERKSSESTTYDVLFVEGESYRKLVARNDEPLSAKEAAEEEKKLQQTAAERRQHGEHHPMTYRAVSVASLDDTLRLSSCYLVGPETLKDRVAWVVECKPREGAKPKGGKDKQTLATMRRMWIDQQSHQLVKVRDTALEGHATLGPGSIVESEYSLINNEVWMNTSTVIDGHLHFAGLIKPRVRTEYVYTNFKKFDVQSTVKPQ